MADPTAPTVLRSESRGACLPIPLSCLSRPAPCPVAVRIEVVLVLVVVLPTCWCQERRSTRSRAGFLLECGSEFLVDDSSFDC
ncbi:hypothetical protein PR202_ga28996 [Eleusine coracana subsp. coracana]|uniref:Uncharacterized protein n=1 Tax=Eleusine coracana subsp. coracana TaxID=191504 RepID=A0AAV5DKW5_ELECO|nr:hypothetical protein PR202_ga28996 [Eleusine coracana subsp. coracana]